MDLPPTRRRSCSRAAGAFICRAVYSVSRAGRGPRGLVSGGSEPTLSPHGRRLAFIRDQHLWIARRDRAGARAVTSGEIAEPGPDWAAG